MEFLSTPSGWRATDNGVTFWRNGDISIHALRVEGDPAIAKGRCSRSISIHALRVEGDTTACTCIRGSIVDFYPRPPGGGRLAVFKWLIYFDLNFYPRPPGGGRPYDFLMYIASTAEISIHALRVEGDADP